MEAKAVMTNERLRAIVAAAMIGGLIAVVPQTGCAGPSMPAHYDKHETIVTDTFESGPDGGTFQPPLRGLPTDGVSLELPKHSVNQPVTLSLGYCKGDIHLAAGTPAGVVLSIGAKPQPRFQQPLKILVMFRPDPKYQTLVGYAIDETGRFHSIDLVDLDMKQGRVTFLTFQPLTLTWAYVGR